MKPKIKIPSHLCSLSWSKLKILALERPSPFPTTPTRSLYCTVYVMQILQVVQMVKLVKERLYVVG